MNETHVTVRGNLVADPDRISSAKGDFTTFRIAVNEFYRDQAGGGYVDGRSSFYKVVAFRAVGTNVHQSLKKGMPVLIHGNLRMSQWQTSTGETRSAPEIEALNVGPDLRFGIATYQKIPNQAQRASGFGAGAAAGAERPGWQDEKAAPVVDQWANEANEPSEGPDFVESTAADQASSSGPLVDQHAV